MAWDESKCEWGYPAFNNLAAAGAVTNADFGAAVFVKTSDSGKTKKAYTYYLVGGYRICVVGDVHKDKDGKWTVAGNSWIPGWLEWQMKTPDDAVEVIGVLSDTGSFPDDDRYPHKAE